MDEKLKQILDDARRKREERSLTFEHLSPEKLDKIDLEKLKELYLEKNPYSRPKNLTFGDSWSEWNFSKSDKINFYISKLQERGRTDLLEEFEKFKLEKAEEAEREEIKKIKDDLTKKGINITAIIAESPDLLNYIVDLEKRLRNIESRII